MNRNTSIITSGLYTVYRFTHKLSSKWKGRVSLLGLFFIFAFPLIFMVALTYYRLSTFYLFMLFSLIVVVAFLCSFFRLARCSVKRRVPAQALTGEEFFYEVELTNLSNRTLHSALLHDEAPDLAPSRSEFLNAKEPGEELRNIADRFLKYYRWLWLIKRKSSYVSQPVVLPDLEPGESRSVTLSCVPLKRGRITFPATKLLLPDPLGLFQKVVKLPSDAASITVLPKRYRLPEVNLDGVSRDQIGGQSVAKATGQTDEVVGLREYRPGDPPKHIHWRSWAKTGKPIVREYEDVFFPRYGLVLDTACTYEKSHFFEEAVSITTSFVRSVETKECLLDLIFLNQGAKVQTVGTGVAKSEEMLGLLATVDIDLEPDWQSLSKQVEKHSVALTACIVVLVNFDDERKKLIQRWRSTGMSLLVLVLTEGDAQEREFRELGVIPISVQSVQAELMKKLAHLE